MRYDAVVIGGGPSGSAVATALARQGRAVAIVERSEFPRSKVCGEFISAVNLALLDRLGVGDSIRALAGPEIRRVALFAGGTGIEAKMPRAPTNAFGRALGRDVLDTLLLEAAAEAGATVLQPWQAVDAVPDGDDMAVHVECKDEQRTLVAPIVVAAHGSWEPGGLPSQMKKRHQPSDFLGFKAHFRDSSLPPDLMPLLAFPGGYGGMVWSDQGRMSISCCIRRDRLAQVRAEHSGMAAGEAVFRHILAACPGVAEALRHARLDGSWLAAGPIRPGLRAAYADDIFRVGNIAGESHPIIAEGISMALQSGWLLAGELARVPDWNRAGRRQAGLRYAAAWRRQFAVRILTASALAGLASRPLTAGAMHQFVRAFPASLFLGAQLSGKISVVPGLG
ncbi:MAG: monooxygenase FAD-binding [Devosia sp.]|uniref:NAD(P)/FAD-dependent oxidoreductase n=1 Tax=Devosia sp. TaxID=1871048 RepID=UPI002613021D|nr:NAD(P)/FAD-dependent oxidoreductase [Devosia sp.]MDB5542129.1 monooxygenase FAD-binding [Devosia sp.]